MRKNSRYCPFKIAVNTVLFQLKGFFRECVYIVFYKAVFRLMCRVFVDRVQYVPDSNKSMRQVAACKSILYT